MGKRTLMIIILVFIFIVVSIGCRKFEVEDSKSNNNAVNTINTDIKSSGVQLENDITINTKTITDGSYITAAEHDWGFTVDDNLVKSIDFNRASFAVSYGDNIYFTLFKTDSLVNTEGTLYRMSNDGKIITKITDLPARFMSIYMGNLFFTDSSDNSKLCTFEIESNKIQVIYDDASVLGYAIIDNWIYFLEMLEGSDKLYLSKINTSGEYYERLITDKNLSNLIYNDKFVYYSDLSSTFELNRLNIDNQNSDIVFTGYYLPYGISDDVIILENSGPHTLDMNTSELKRLIPIEIESGVNQFNFHNNSIIYNSKRQEIYSYDGSQKELVYNEFPVNSFSITGDWMFMHVSKGNESSNINPLVILNLETKEVLNYELN